jgi:hypothetical protein
MKEKCAMSLIFKVIIVGALICLAATAYTAEQTSAQAKSIERGRDMTTQDLRDLYRYVRFLGPAGEPAPAFVPPGQQPKGPAVQFPAPPK